MSTFISTVARFTREEDAPTMLEYGLLVAAVAILVGVTSHQLGQVCAEFFRDAAVVTSIRSEAQM